MDFELENELRPLLQNDERLLWTGKPRGGILFRTTDIFFIPFSLLWFSFAIFWMYNALKMGGGIFPLFGIPFILVGLYISAGRFFADAYKRKKTMYGITDSRVIIKTDAFRSDLKSISIRNLPDISLKEKADGSGTISLGPSDFRYSIFNGMGNRYGVNQSPSLEYIDEARKVYNIILGLQRNKS